MKPDISLLRDCWSTAMASGYNNFPSMSKMQKDFEQWMDDQGIEWREEEAESNSSATPIKDQINMCAHRMHGEFIGTLEGICQWDIPVELKEKLKIKLDQLMSITLITDNPHE